MARRHAVDRLLTTRPPPSNGNTAAGYRTLPIVRNRLLAALPALDFVRLLPMLTETPLELKAVLHRPGEPIRHVYFPGGGFLSIVTVLENGRMVEVATIGREGMAGSGAVLDGLRTAPATMVQGASDLCYRMTAEAFRAEMDRGGPFHTLLVRYSHAMLGGIMQGAACNAVHSVEQRLARWLLMAHDRMDSNRFALTQEFASMMLGASRPTVSIVAGQLQAAGLIRYRRGTVTVLDRTRLEAAACECYRVTTNLLAAVLPAHARAAGS
jgi:CRP-like cAMP-binding protein